MPACSLVSAPHLAGNLRFYSTWSRNEQGGYHHGHMAVIKTSQGTYVTVVNVEDLGPPFPVGWDMGAEVAVTGYT